MLRKVPAITILCVAIAQLLMPSTALAHETRKLGKYQLVVGFINEPALVDEPNGIDLRITNVETNQPVEGVDKTLKAEVIFGSKVQAAELRARFGSPGAYTSNIIPTKAGTYTFHFTGNIEGLSIDERFESGPGRFNDVQPKDDLQFPDKQPSIATLAQRAASSEQEAGNSRLFGIAGLVLGAVGTFAGLASLRRRGNP